MSTPFQRKPLLVLLVMPLTALLAYLAGVVALWPHAVGDTEEAQRQWMREAGTNYAAQIESVINNAYATGHLLRSLPADLTGLTKSGQETLFADLLKKNDSICGIWILQAPAEAVHERLLAPGSSAPANRPQLLNLHLFRNGEAGSETAEIVNDLFKLQNAYIALKQNSDLISQPYHDGSSGRIVISLVFPLQSPHEGVLGLDIPAERLYQIIRDFDRNIGYGSVVSDDMLLVCHSVKADLPDQSVRGNPQVKAGIEILRNLRQYEYRGNSIVGNKPSFKVYTRVGLPVNGRYWSVNLILLERGLAGQALLRHATTGVTAGLAACLLLAAAGGYLVFDRVRRSLGAYISLLDAARLPLLAADAEQRVLFMNQAALRLAQTGAGAFAAGVSPVGRPCHEVIGWRLAGESHCPLQRLLHHQSRRTFFTLNNRPYEVDAGFLGGEGTGLLYAVFYDRVDLCYLRPVLDASPEAILIVDAGNFEVQEANLEALSLYGCNNRERLIGRTLRVAAETEPAPASIAQPKPRTEPQDERPGITPDCFRTDTLDPIEGVELPARQPKYLRKSVQRTLIGGREYYVLSMLDITGPQETAEQLGQRNGELEQLTVSLKQQQQQLLHQEKMASIGQLAAGVAHEINNPIGFVTSNLHTLQEYLAVFHRLFSVCDGLLEAGDDLGRIHELTRQLAAIASDEDVRFILDDAGILASESIEGMNRVRDIVKNLKSFARIDADDSTEVDLNEQLRLTLKMTNNELKYKCAVIEDYGELPRVPGNAGELNQVFMNLIVNAAAAIAEKGTITVRSRVEPDGRISVSISDTGCGIAPENLSRIFDPFFTTKEVGKGTGLGLYISHGIIEKHGGDIVVRSEPGKGSIFTVYLPQEGSHV